MTPVVRAIQKAQTSVVNIHSTKTNRTKRINGGLFPSSKPEKVNGMGTGVIIDSRGYIVTNHHVVKDVDSLRVTLADGKSHLATVVGIDSAADIAVIKIDSKKKLPTMPLGTSSDLMLGETTLVIGNPFGYEHSVSKGIVSHLSRDVEVNESLKYYNLIQTDAAINPGNSGGPLVNLEGDVIGINVAIRAGAQRIGFAIPIDQARRVVARIFNVENLNGTTHGIVTRDHKKGKDRKLVVEQVVAGTPAAKAGFRKGDIITRANSIAVTDRVDLERACVFHPIATPVKINVLRDGKDQQLSFTLRRLSRMELAARKARIKQSIVVPERTASKLSIANRKAWSKIGLQLRPHALSPAQASNTRYRGGMIVTAVRRGSTSQKNGIRTGDVLVGLHVWETVNEDNINYVLDHPKLGTFSPLKFYILRGKETLYGHLKVN